ncbi:MAG: DUF916 domain-containing protein, partial [Patescibacteria group bacterium]|nr:DUF916 domain-containing protein [Patescibacteria group bacterium]
SFWPLKSRAIGFQGIGGYPANPDSEDDLTKAWFTFEIDPGEKKEDALIVVNESEKAEKILLYPVDSTEDNLGGFALSKRGDEHNEIGSWVELGKNELVLSPGEKLKVSFTLRIPSGTSPGEYAGGIIIQKANSDKDPQTGFSINTRLGIRVYATVTGQIIRNLELLPLEIEKNRKDRKLRLGAILNNKGNAYIIDNIQSDSDVFFEDKYSQYLHYKEYMPKTDILERAEDVSNTNYICKKRISSRAKGIIFQPEQIQGELSDYIIQKRINIDTEYRVYSIFGKVIPMVSIKSSKSENMKVKVL